VIERSKILSYDTLRGSVAVDGIKDYITSTGDDVALVDDDTFQIVMTNEVLRRS
jgi:hypothetical protein